MTTAVGRGQHQRGRPPEAPRLDRRDGGLLREEPQNSNIAIAPNVNLAGTLEAIEKFAFVDVSANVYPSFLSPFGPQPANLVNATNNRYISQTYAVSPYIRGRIPGSNMSYQVRDDNFWTASSPFGDSSISIPNTYANDLTRSMSAPASPVGLDAGVQPVLLRQRPERRAGSDADHHAQTSA